MTTDTAPAEALSARLEAVMEHFETHFAQGNGMLTLDADPELTDLLRDAAAALARAEAAEAERDRLREALSFYANSFNYQGGQPCSMEAGDRADKWWWKPDMGERARSALAGGES